MRVAIIGSNQETANEMQMKIAFDLGRALIDAGHTIINGGMGGTMEQTAKGARESVNWKSDSVIAILPRDNPHEGNRYTEIKIATHLGTGRNRLIILNSDVVIALGGGAGTLNEITLAWELGKPLAAFTGVGGWSDRIAGEQLDERRKDKILGLSTISDVLDWLDVTENNTK
ncbi:MAG: TIGR00725 family protein [Candidatus Heimdallarchaeota archaeon]|nr:TIGR00725 family protein [Candidatus Heimdallarchaeota archaeon]